MTKVDLIKNTAARFDFMAGMVDVDVAEALAASQAEPPSVPALRVWERGPDDPTGMIYGGLTGVSGTVYAAGTTVLDLTAAAACRDVNVNNIIGAGADPLGTLYVTGIRVEVQHNECTPAEFQAFLNNAALYFKAPTTSAVYVQMSECAGTFLPLGAPCEGATAALASATRRQAVTKWLPNPFVVNLNQDSFSIVSVNNGFTVGGTAGLTYGVDVHVYGVVWPQSLGNLKNSPDCDNNLDGIKRRLNRRRGMAVFHRQVIPRGV